MRQLLILFVNLFVMLPAAWGADMVQELRSPVLIEAHPEQATVVFVGLCLHSSNSRRVNEPSGLVICASLFASVRHRDARRCRMEMTFVLTSEQFSATVAAGVSSPPAASWQGA